MEWESFLYGYLGTKAGIVSLAYHFFSYFALKACYVGVQTSVIINKQGTLHWYLKVTLFGWPPLPFFKQ